MLDHVKPFSKKAKKSFPAWMEIKKAYARIDPNICQKGFSI